MKKRVNTLLRICEQADDRTVCLNLLTVVESCWLVAQESINSTTRNEFYQRPKY